MKNLKLILVMTLASVFAVLIVVNMSLAKPEIDGTSTLDMLEIMTLAFDESEGGESGGGTHTCYDTFQKKWLSNHYHFIHCWPCEPETAHMIWDKSTCSGPGGPA